MTNSAPRRHVRHVHKPDGPEAKAWPSLTYLVNLVTIRIYDTRELNGRLFLGYGNFNPASVYAAAAIFLSCGGHGDKAGMPNYQADRPQPQCTRHLCLLAAA